MNFGDYVIGFVFNENYTEVLLVLKKSPPWQEGCFNGIGGKIEPDEEPSSAMLREFEEETGRPLLSCAMGYSYFATMRRDKNLPRFQCFCYVIHFQLPPVKFCLSHLTQQALTSWQRITST